MLLTGRTYAANIETFAGNGSAGPPLENVHSTDTPMYWPTDVTVGPDGRQYIVDFNNHKIRVVDNGVISTLIGDGFGDPQPGFADQVNLNLPMDVAFDPTGHLYVAAWHNSKVLRMNMATQWVDIIAGSGVRGFAGDGGPAASAVLNYPSSVAVDSQGQVYIADQVNFRIRRIALNGTINTVVGSGVNGYCGDFGPAISACLSNPSGVNPNFGGKIAFDSVGNLYIADTKNNCIRRVDTNGIISTIAGTTVAGYSGDGGPAVLASLNEPVDVAVGPDDNLYIADSNNHCVRMVDGAGVIFTVAGTGGVPGYSGDGANATLAQLNMPTGIGLDALGNVFIADTFNHRIRVVVNQPTPVGATPTGGVSLYANHPNPFSPSTTIEYSAEKATPVSLRVYNVEGKLVRTLVDGERRAGTRAVSWDGRDDSGRAVSSGVYFYRIDSGRVSQTRRMVLLK
jgi:sugar lactone lactonase YvrE